MPTPERLALLASLLRRAIRESAPGIGLSCASVCLGSLIALELPPKLQSPIFGLSYGLGGFLLARAPARALGSGVQRLLAPVMSAFGCAYAGWIFTILMAAEGTRFELTLGSSWFWLQGGAIASGGFVGRGRALLVPLLGALGFALAGALGRMTLDLLASLGSTVTGVVLAPVAIFLIGGALLAAASNTTRRVTAENPARSS